MISDVLAEYMENPLKDYYICYFDILGYRAFFENETKAHKNFLAKVELICESVHSIIRNSHLTVKVNCKTYSDNFLLYFEKDLLGKYDALKILSNLIRKISIKLLCDFEVLIRGSITIGEFFADDNIVFGKGLVDAVEIEEKKAINPRIVIDSVKFDIDLSKLFSDNCIIKDADDIIFVNCFKSIEALKLTRGKCIRLINYHGKYHPTVKEPVKVQQAERVISKYIWLLIQFNNQCKILGYPDLLIDYELKINERLLKTEIIVKSGSNK